MSEELIRILIADDHTVVRKALCKLLELTGQIQVVGEAQDGAEAVEKARTLQPEVILLDLMMPRLSGLDAIQCIKGENPAARILVLTSFDEEEKAFPAIKAGALGYLLKDVSPADLVQAIQQVYRNEPSLHPTIARKLMQELRQPAPLPEPLTERELEILRSVARGLTNQEIARALGIAERTVQNHMGHILAKLHLANRTQATLYALRKKLVDEGGPLPTASQ
jgi:NarL family two-component system response regulator LiaR